MVIFFQCKLCSLSLSALPEFFYIIVKMPRSFKDLSSSLKKKPHSLHLSQSKCTKGQLNSEEQQKRQHQHQQQLQQHQQKQLQQFYKELETALSESVTRDDIASLWGHGGRRFVQGSEKTSTFFLII